MRLDKIPLPKFLQLHRHELNHWKDYDEMHEVLHSLPGYFKALTLELLERPMSRKDIQETVYHLEMRMGHHHKKGFKKIDIDRDIDYAIKQGVLDKKYEKYFLTSRGREIAEHMQQVIPFFVENIFSARMVSAVTIAVHVLLSILKLTFGFISGSAGLIADGIDNTVDTISSVLVWLGIKYDRGKSTSVFIVLMMFVSVCGIAVACYNKITHLGPVEQGLSAFIISALCGLIMLVLSAYQYMTGTKISNFAIMCQSVDSRNHFLTSVLVCSGIVLSSLAQILRVSWLYYADAVASAIIGCLILISVVELSRELMKPGDEPTYVSHFMRNAQEKMRIKIILNWLLVQLKDTPLTLEQLEERFTMQFCDHTPRILVLPGMGYRPDGCEHLALYLDKLVKSKKLLLSEGKYILPESSH